MNHLAPQPAFPKPEIKSPAGHWPQLHAAIEAGADAVYFGLSHFTARAKAGFTLAELPEAMRTLRSRGVKGYITFNTLIFDDELLAAARGLAAIAEAGADAIIVQDWAAVALARKIAPQLQIHGSTQMSVTDAAGANQAQEMGVDRLILARELSLDEIGKVRANTGVELEIFCHGALCVSYSGQCFSSEAWGGRSANRGQCAQACRLPYELMVDGRLAADAAASDRYLLSPGDLYALEQMPEIVQIGLSALKIEGRYKDAEYVALTTRAYRKAVDDAYAGLTTPVPVETKLQLEQVYSRGLGPWFLTGTNHQTVVDGRAPRHRGVRIGNVVRISQDGVVIAMDRQAPPLKAGDGIVFDAADWRSPQEREEGGRIYSVTEPRRGQVELTFANNAIDPSRIRTGDLIWRTDDPDIARAARPYLEATVPVARQDVDVRVVAHEGLPLTAIWNLTGDPNVSVTVQSDQPLGLAQSRALSEESLREQLGRLGNTAYQLHDLQLEILGAPFAPASLLNQLRRTAVERLIELQAKPDVVEVREPESVLAGMLDSGLRSLAVAAREELTTLPGPSNPGPQLHLLVRTPEQLDAAILVRPASITLDYLDLYGLRPSIARVKASGIEARVASPRVLKPGEERIADFLLRCDCPILVRPAGLLETLRGRTGQRLDGDFSLNAANAISAAMLFDKNIGRLTPTHDLNAAQIAQLALAMDGPADSEPRRMEAVAYQHLPVFHTEHCVFCRFMSKGTSYKDCGRPCEKHRVALKDSSGLAHALIADVGCRNTVFGAEAQVAAAHMDTWIASGIRHYRLEFVHESADAVKRIATAFGEYLDRRIPQSELRRRLQQLAPEGVTEGSLFVPESALFPVLQ
ncbi:MAG: U32 family peptidase [Acidobacteriota bacterium]